MADLRQIDLVSGKAGKDISGSDVIFKQPLRPDLLNDYVVMQRRGLRQGTHSTKTRSEVSGTTKKPFKQKGTGNARQGSLKGPHQYGGGICFGPKPRMYQSRLPKKLKLKAIQVALSQKRFESKLFVVSSFDVASGKTKDAVALLTKISAKSALVVGNFSDATQLACRNLDSIKLLRPEAMNVMDLLKYETCLLTEEALRFIEANLVQVKREQISEEKVA